VQPWPDLVLQVRQSKRLETEERECPPQLFGSLCYNALMSFWRKAGLVIIGSLLPLLLFSWGFLFSAYQVFGTPDHIKNALKESGIYNTLVSDIMSQPQDKEGQAKTEEIPVDQAEVKRIIGDAAPPAYLQLQVEKFLDVTYNWVNGQNEHLQVEIDLTEVKTKLRESLGQHTTARLQSLPVCSGPVDPEAFDPLKAECLPKGTDINAAAEKIKAEVDKAFKDPVITQDDIGHSLEQQLHAAPVAYQSITKGLWALGLLIVMLTAGLLLLSQPWWRGLKRVGITFIAVGAASGLLAFFAAFGLKKAAETLKQEGELQASAVTVFKLLAEDLRTWWLGFGIAVVVLGIAALVTKKLLKKPEAADNDHKPHEQKAPEHLAPKEDNPQTRV